MHSVIYQISTEAISKANYINAEDIEAGEMTSLDYAYETKAEERKELIKELAERILPKGMFSIGQDGETLIYQGDFDEWRKSYLKLIKNRAAAITEVDVMKWIGPTYQLQKAIVNPLETDSLFVVDFGLGYSLAERSREIMLMVEQLNVGERIYIGAILGYHF